ncbi:hypothetical protein [Paenibacillus pectinilyticus]|uniref:hypothetical protein n=1 Tax=Paenibacillus pectinilyticus TaxID=512399 RepID=UPI001428ADFC|nr:hypothetical protein [Paenibacillus pectinilyticus]
MNQVRFYQVGFFLYEMTGMAGSFNMVRERKICNTYNLCVKMKSKVSQIDRVI